METVITYEVEISLTLNLHQLLIITKQFDCHGENIDTT